MMIPEFKILQPQQLIGKRLSMSFAQNRTAELWKSFMPRRKEITNAVNEELISMQVYNPDFDFSRFDPNASFEKWAAVAVNDFDAVPDEMETFILPEGLYAVFHYKGSPDQAQVPFGYIFGSWLPASEYEPDNRPHFEIIGARYKNGDPDSEEDIWIPIRPKQVQNP